MYEFYFFSLFLVIIAIIAIINLYLITDILDKKINYYSLNFMLFLNFSGILLSIIIMKFLNWHLKNNYIFMKF